MRLKSNSSRRLTIDVEVDIQTGKIENIHAFQVLDMCNGKSRAEQKEQASNVDTGVVGR